MAKDYYDLLGISRQASDEEIKRAYRKLAHQHHPDKGGDQEKFKEINEAYQILSDKSKRSQYDQFGQTFTGPAGGGAGGGGFNWQDFAQSGSGNFSAGGGPASGWDFGDLGDIFGDVFGGGSRRRRGKRGPVQGSDLEMEMVVDFDVAMRGGTEMVSLYKKATCSRCGGNGAEPGTKITTCPDCKGSGQVTASSQTMFGVFEQVQVCGRCGGEGKVALSPCSRCSGEGRVREEEKLEIQIPAGIDTGQAIRLAGKGEAGRRGGASGDLLIAVRVKPSPTFVREGETIRTQIPLSFAQAALGDEVRVETLDGEVLLKIPAGTQAGKEFILRDRGVPRLNGGGRGDHIVTVQVITPKKLSARERKLFEEMTEGGGQSVKVDRGFWNKFKDKFQ